MKLRYFAWVRERVGVAEEEVDLPADAATVGDVIAWLKTRGDEYGYAFEAGDAIRAAIDQEHVEHSSPVTGAREIAFFPPVTGG